MSTEPQGQVIVVFGASGDLGRRKIFPALYNLAREGRLPERLAIVGYALKQWDDEGFRNNVRNGIQEFSRTPLDEQVWEQFADSLSYVCGPYDVPGCFGPLQDHLRVGDRRLYYLSTPPSVFTGLIARFKECGSQVGNRVVIEKPFGRDLASARELNRLLHEVFEEPQIFRIDHFLGKEAIHNLFVYRFANTGIERLWNRDGIDHVQITAAEPIGVEGRGGFYEETGAVRDMVQNHLLQLMAWVAMDPPVALDPEAIRDEIMRVLRAVRPFRPEDALRGQYTTGVVGDRKVPGYREELDVACDSNAETFVAIRASIDNWKWAEVPFFLQTGKRLPLKSTEVTITFKPVPTYLFESRQMDPPPPNRLSFRIQPREGITHDFQGKVPGLDFEMRTVEMDFTYRDWFAGPAEAYERLLYDAMTGNPTLFIRQDAVERAWEIVAPLLDHQGPLVEYPAGSWNPAAVEFIAPRTWHVEERGAGARLGDVMTREIFTVGPQATVAEVATALAHRRFGSALVLQDSQLVGILTERDVVRAAGSGINLTTAPTREWMTPQPVTGSPEMTVKEASAVMADRGFRHLPVLTDGKVVGIASVRDVLTARVYPRPPDQVG